MKGHRVEGSEEIYEIRRLAVSRRLLERTYGENEEANLEELIEYSSASTREEENSHL
jgi:hypothetical protein